MTTIKRIKNSKVPYEYNELIKRYKDTAIFWAAEIENNIAGIIGLKELNKDSGEIVSLAVYEKYQNKRIGTELIEKAIAYSKEKNYRELTVKTGNSGIKQLYIYQRCGFRFDGIKRDYFREHYGRPLFENGIQCVDQIILKYRIYSKIELENLTKEYWYRFIRKNPEYKNCSYEVWNFCYGEYLPNKLIGLVKEGQKTATSSALELYEEDEKKPETGDISILTYGNQIPGCIIRTEETRVKSFKDITAEEARMEGEGDLSLKYWRDAHRHFFKLEYEEMGKKFNEDIPVIFERFKVIYDEDIKEKPGSIQR